MKVIKKLPLFAALLFSIVACSQTKFVGENVVVNATPLSTNDPVFDQNLAKWKAASIKNYDFTASMFVGGVGGYAYPVIISVREGEYIGIKALDKDNLGGMKGYEAYNTVEKMFELIRSRLTDEFPAKVRYNEKYGYPEDISISNPRFVDAWRSFEISNFTVLQSPESLLPMAVSTSDLDLLKRFAEEYEPKSGQVVIPSPPVLDQKLSEIIASAARSNAREHEKYVFLIFLKLSRFQIENFKQRYELGRANPLTKEFFRLIAQADYERAEIMPSSLIDNYIEKHPNFLEYQPIKVEVERINRASEKIKGEGLKQGR